MHKNRICHRDLKPHNILCLKGEENKNNNILDQLLLKVTDFNVSKFTENYKEI